MTNFGAGGDEKGHPGVAIWFQGADVGALVSTGNLTWLLNVRGQRPIFSSDSSTPQWSNIAIKWKPLMYSNAAGFVQEKQKGKILQELGGLELLIDSQPIGYVLQPLEVGCSVQASGQECNATQPQPSLDPPTVMLGCHKTAASQEPGHFLSGKFDEIAIWERALNDSDTSLLIGGYSEQNMYRSNS